MASCSWVSSQRSLFGDDGEYVGEQAVQTVPKTQYDQLLEKYETLLKDSSTAADGAPIQSGIEKEELLNALSTAQSNPQGAGPELAETVDVFAVSPKTSTQQSNTAAASVDYSKVDIEGQIMILRRAESFLVENKIDDAMNEIRKVENSSVRQIRVRAKYLLGELLLVQNEYDLAMQVFKEIITKDAFSGVVYKTLGRLILCAEKLQLEQEKERYYSMLHEIFEA
jgi:TolA-binding protein